MAVLLFGGLAVANIAQGKVTVVVVALLAMAALGFYLLTVDIRAARVAGRR